MLSFGCHGARVARVHSFLCETSCVRARMYEKKDMTVPNQHDITITDLGLDLESGSGDIPISPVVATMNARISDAALTTGVKAILLKVGDRAPGDVDFEEARFVPGGAEITVEAGMGRLLKAKVTAVVAITASGSEAISVKIDEIRALGKLPVEGFVSPIIEKGLEKATATAGVESDPNEERAILIYPNVLLKSQGIDLTFKEPGAWSVMYGPGFMDVSFTSI